MTAATKRVLVLTTDLPFFPGKNGHDFFNLRHLAGEYRVGVVAPTYDSHPAEGVRNLEAAVDDLYLWPRDANRTPLFVSHTNLFWLPRIVRLLPVAVRRGLLLKLLRLNRQPNDAFERVAILANCAPQLLQALYDRPWEAMVVIQSSLGPWLDYLPRFGAKLVYFHDVRSDYFQRATARPSESELQAILHQERSACQAADAVGFVSTLDHQRARKLFPLPATHGVGPIPVDLEYFRPRPSERPAAAIPTVLFTGHLRHPPNVDAVLYFLEKIWPGVLCKVPTARFVAAGLSPHPDIAAAIARSPNTELHASVPDIRPYFWDASVYVIPMRYGGGVRQKIFEAWSMRVPVVSTVMGAEGAGAQNGISCWLEDTPEGFAARVVNLLLKSPPQEVLDRAQTQVAQTNSIPVAASEFRALVGQTIAARKRKPFRLLFDLRWMKLGEAGGAEQMTYELVHAISQLDHQNAYRFYVPRSTFTEWELGSAFNHRAFYSDDREKSWEAIVASATNRLAESLNTYPVLTPEMRTLRAYHRMDFDLVHSMLGYIHPDLQAFPHVLTVLDLQHLTYPEFFSRSDWETRENLYRTSAQRAAHITCISEYTRQEVHRHYGIPLERMTTVWIIPSRNIWIPTTESERSRVLRGHGITGPYLFFPAHCWPHKNHVRLIEAFALIAPHMAKDIQLVLTGRPFPADHPARQVIAEKGLEGRVLHLGYRSPLEVRALYQGCMLVVFPSLFEGFGMPVAEAMVAEKPVACSNVTSLPEIAGNAALTFDPKNIHDIGGRLLEIINDPERRSHLVNEARRRRPLFSARRIALKTLSIYQRLHEALYAT